MGKFSKGPSRPSRSTEYRKRLAELEDFIRKNDGAWMVNTSEQPNFESLSSKEKNSLDNQLLRNSDHNLQYLNRNILLELALRQMALQLTHLDPCRQPWNQLRGWTYYFQ